MHRQAVAEVLRGAAEGPRRAQRPRGGDVHRPHDRQGLRPRAASRSTKFDEHQRAGCTRPAGGRSSSPGIIFPLMNFINNIGYVLVCVVGGILVTKRAIAASATSRRSSSTRGSSPCPSRRRPTSPTSSSPPSPRPSGCSSCWTRRRRLPDAADAAVLASPQGEVRFEDVQLQLQGGRAADRGHEHRRQAGADHRHRRARPAPARPRWSTC